MKVTNDDLSELQIKIMKFLSKNNKTEERKLLRSTQKKLSKLLEIYFLIYIVSLIIFTFYQPNISMIIWGVTIYEIIIYYMGKRNNSRIRNKKITLPKGMTYTVEDLIFGEDIGKCILIINNPLILGYEWSFLVDDQRPKVSGIISDNKIYFSFDVSTTNESINILFENKLYTYKNPYYLSLKPELLECKIVGRDGELCIHIQKSCIPNALEHIKYAFDVKINRIIHEGFVGKLNKECGEIVIKLRVIQDDFLKNSCQLRAHFEKNYFIQLPKPKTIVHRNGVQIIV